PRGPGRLSGRVGGRRAITRGNHRISAGGRIASPGYRGIVRGVGRWLVEWAKPDGERRGTMKYSGILRIGFKLLVNDKAKFSALLIGITFAVFLMMQMTAMFAGILICANWTLPSAGASPCTMDPP